MLIDYELFHYGVKGMRWGMHKTQPTEKKLTKKLAKIGRIYGDAAYQRYLGDEIYKKNDKYAKLFDRTDNEHDSKKYVRSSLSRNTATMIRKRGKDAKTKRYNGALYLETKGDKLMKKADAFATEKRVFLGEEYVNSIINNVSNERLAQLKKKRKKRESRKLENTKKTAEFLVGWIT